MYRSTVSRALKILCPVYVKNDKIISQNVKVVDVLINTARISEDMIDSMTGGPLIAVLFSMANASVGHVAQY